MQQPHQKTTKAQGKKECRLEYEGVLLALSVVHATKSISLKFKLLGFTFN